MPLASLHVCMDMTYVVFLHTSVFVISRTTKRKIKLTVIIYFQLYFSLSVRCRPFGGTPTSGPCLAELHPRQRADVGSRKRAAMLSGVGPLAARYIYAGWDVAIFKYDSALGMHHLLWFPHSSADNQHRIKCMYYSRAVNKFILR